MEIVQPLTILHFLMFVLFFILSVVSLRQPFTNTRVTLSIAMACVAIWALAKAFMHNTAASYELAKAALDHAFYFHLLSFSMLLLLAVLVRTSGRVANNYLYILAAVAVNIPLSAYFVRHSMYLLVRTDYGWAAATNPALSAAYNIYVIGQTMLSFFIMLSGFFSKDRINRLISIMMLVSLMIPLLFYFFAPYDNIISNSADFQSFPMYITFFLAATRFGLFDMTENVSINTLINNIREYLLLTDLKGRILQSNPAFRAAFPGADTLSGLFRSRPDFDILAGSSSKAPASVTGYAGINRPDGNLMYAAVSVTALKRIGRPAAMLWVLSDITDKHDLEKHLREHGEKLEEEVKKRTEELLASNRELQKANEDLEDFANASYHDLREPLRTISLNLQLMERQGIFKADPEAQAGYSFILGATERMNDLIGAIRQYVSLKKGKTGEKADLNVSLQDALNTLREKISASGAKINTSSLPVVPGNRALYASVFYNLIDNALKYSAGTPVIDIAYDGKGTVSVADNGIGISPEYLGKIFEMFVRLHTFDKYPGTGMGLAICKKIMELNGGRIWAESAGSGGTTVRFTVKSVE